jgi:hypothetical protein
MWSASRIVWMTWFVTVGMATGARADGFALSVVPAAADEVVLRLNQIGEAHVAVSFTGLPLVRQELENHGAAQRYEIELRYRTPGGFPQGEPVYVRLLEQTLFQDGTIGDFHVTFDRANSRVTIETNGAAALLRGFAVGCRWNSTGSEFDGFKFARITSSGVVAPDHENVPVNGRTGTACFLVVDGDLIGYDAGTGAEVPEAMELIPGAVARSDTTTPTAQLTAKAVGPGGLERVLTWIHQAKVDLSGDTPTSGSLGHVPDKTWHVVANGGFGLSDMVLARIELLRATGGPVLVRDTVTFSRPGVAMVVVNDAAVPPNEGPAAVAVGTSLPLRAVPGYTAFPAGEPVWSIESKPEGSSLTAPEPGATASIAADAIGDYVVKAACDGIGDTFTINAVGVATVIVDGSNPEDEGPATVAVGQTVTLRAKPNPAGANFPGGKPTWAVEDKPAQSTLGNPAAGTTAAIVPDCPGTYTLTATCGTSSKTFTINAVALWRVQYEKGGEYTDVYGPLHVIKGATVTFKALPYPEGAAWPSGTPAWSGSAGASGTGATKAVTFSTASTGPSDYKTVVVACGSSSLTVEVLVVEAMITEVTFSASAGMCPVYKDDGTGVYPTPHWQDTTAPPDNVAEAAYPVAFVRGSTMLVATIFQLADGVTHGTAKVRGNGPGDLDFPAVDATVSGSAVTVAAHVCAASLPDTVYFYGRDGFVPIAWEISFDGGTTWMPAGSTSNQIYGLLDTPALGVWPHPPLLHTLAHLACKNCDGDTDPDDITAHIWGDFAARQVYRASDGHQLTYYAKYDTKATSTGKLVETGDGQCGAWATLFLDVRRVHGITNTADYMIFKSETAADVGFVVKSWHFSDTGTSGDPTYPYFNVLPPGGDPVGVGASSYTWRCPPEVSDLDETAQDSLPGQGNINPASWFGNHQIVVLGNTYYDPSYGVTKTCTSLDDILLDITTNAIAGFYKEGTLPLDETALGVDLNGDSDADDTAVSCPCLLFRKNENPGGTGKLTRYNTSYPKDY